MSTLAVVTLASALLTWLVLRSAYQSLPPLPWTGVPALLIAAAAEAWSGRDLRRRIAGRAGTKPPHPLFVSRMLVLAKASSLAAAVVGGLSLGFVGYLSGLVSAVTPRHDMINAGATCGAALVLAAAALYLEYCCRVPTSTKPPADTKVHLSHNDISASPRTCCGMAARSGEVYCPVQAQAFGTFSAFNPPAARVLPASNHMGVTTTGSGHHGCGNHGVSNCANRTTPALWNWSLWMGRRGRSVLFMTIMTAAPAPALTPSRPALVTRPLLVRFVSVIGASASFYLMLSVVPLYARSAGASANFAGLTTTALSLSTTAGYLPTPRLVARFGHRVVLSAGLVLLGAPSLALLVSANLTVIMAVCVVRGIGFAIVCVSGGALTASLIPPERRGEGLALVGIVSGVPSVAALPLGVWFAGHVGYRPVMLAASLAALAPLISIPGLPSGGLGRSAVKGNNSMTAGLRNPAVVRPALVFGATTMAAGIFVTFLPLAATHATANVAALALGCQPAASIGGRWLAGRYGDRRGAGPMLVPGVLVTAAGIAMLSLTGSPAAVIAGAVLFGAGFGIGQNVTLTMMYDRVREPDYSMVSAVWNLAYDVGMGAGAAGFGVLAAHTGYPGGFVLTAAVLPVSLLLVAGRRPLTRAR